MQKKVGKKSGHDWLEYAVNLRSNHACGLIFGMIFLVCGRTFAVNLYPYCGQETPMVQSPAIRYTPGRVARVFLRNSNTGNKIMVRACYMVFFLFLLKSYVNSTF